jgi:hypothetical protein
VEMRMGRLGVLRGINFTFIKQMLILQRACRFFNFLYFIKNISFKSEDKYTFEVQPVNKKHRVLKSYYGLCYKNN